MPSKKNLTSIFLEDQKRFTEVIDMREERSAVEARKFNSHYVYNVFPSEAVINDTLYDFRSKKDESSRSVF